MGNIKLKVDLVITNVFHRPISPVAFFSHFAAPSEQTTHITSSHALGSNAAQSTLDNVRCNSSFPVHGPHNYVLRTMGRHNQQNGEKTTTTNIGNGSDDNNKNPAQNVRNLI